MASMFGKDASMRRLLIAVLVLALVAALAAGGLAAQSPASIVFANVTVVPMTGNRTDPGMTVVTTGGRITAVGPAKSTPAPAGAVTVDGTGKFLMPGLSEMHGHVPPVSDRVWAEETLFLYVANGVTTVRGMQGSPGQLELRNDTRTGALTGPALYLAGPAFSGGSVKTPEAAVERVRQQRAEGWDLLKVLPGLSVESYDAMARAAKESGIGFAGHVPAAVGLLHALEMGQETIDHMDGYVELLDARTKPVDDGALKGVIEKTKAAGAWIVPTMFVWETLQGAPTLESRLGLDELKYLPPKLRAQWEGQLKKRLGNPQLDTKAAALHMQNRTRILAAMHQAGVRLLLGSDAPQQFNVPGFSIHHEMRSMAEAKMTPYDVLRTGTAAAGEYLGTKEEPFGTIAVGQRADLILVDGNPLSDLRNVARRSGVMVRGRWLPETEIQKRLAGIAQ
jgi:imidazolonepropionase-like amidohydrolase